MAPAKKDSSPPAVYSPPTATAGSMNAEQEAKLKAEARAYALSSSTSAKAAKRKLPTTTNYQQLSDRPTSLSIHRPDRPVKMAKVDPTRFPLGASMPPGPKLAPPPPPPQQQQPLFQAYDDDDDDYDRFVKSLGLEDSILSSIDNDDEEFHLSDEEEEDDDEDEDTENENKIGSHRQLSTANSLQDAARITPSLSSPISSPVAMLPDFDAEMYRDLEEELGSLLEEDMEAAVQSLMTSRKPPDDAEEVSDSPASVKDQPTETESEVKEGSPTTPRRETARHGTKAHVTYQQSQQLRRLLTRHYQLLVQQAVLAVRAAQMQKLHKEKSEFLSGETADDLAEILDGAVGMLQDLDQNRKDAIRNSIQLSSNSRGTGKGRRSLLSRFTDSSETTEDEDDSPAGDKRLTRAAFSRTLEQNGVVGAKRTAFEIPGLAKLKETFTTIDKSVEGTKGIINVLESTSHTEACKLILRQATANVDESCIPGGRDLSLSFCDAKEFLGPDFQAPCTEEQKVFLRRNRNLFTAGEDNLVLRGVNLYGEKQWILIADRYLPDRSVNIISQRFSKLCLMLYKAQGIHIDSKGNLEEPPRLESVDDIDEDRVKELQLTAVEPPAILNVHRWSLEEDLTLLKAVPIMGHMWAELGARLIPHRDRGHLRKRYQVLERRVKATVARSSKADSMPRPPGAARPASHSKQAIKSTTKQPMNRGTSKKGTIRKPTSEETMSIEKAAASLAFMKPSMNDSRQKKEEAKTSSKPVVSRAASTPQAPSRPPENASSVSRMDIRVSDAGASRAAFEKLVENDEWSQMSRMKRMLENDAESQAADAIVSHLAKTPRQGTGGKANTNSGEASHQLPTAASKAQNGVEPSIMSRVLGGTRKEAADGAESKGKAEISSPRKRSIKKASTPAPPTTPKRTSFFSASGTPMGLSPGFRPSPGNPRDATALTLTPNPTYSPAPSAVMRLMSEPSGDEIRFCDFQISEESRKGIEGAHAKDQQEHDPTPPPLTPSKNSLMLDEFDAIEAISALNSLSNSPFRAPKKDKEGETSKTTDAKKSLFAAVVGESKARDPKARLQF